MKQYIINIVLIFGILICSCQKNELSISLATAEFNGMPWQAEVFTKNLGENRMGVSFEVKENEIRREIMGFQFIPKENGALSMDFISLDTLFRSSYSTISHDGDVIKDFYYLEKSNPSNYISITELIETGVKGEFDLTFIIDTTRVKIDLNAPDTIHFTNGKFDSMVNE